ncbi:MAG TPA: magnesium transporter [Gemmatimonadaceae bacterium]
MPTQHNPERPIAALLAPDILALLDESPQDVALETEEVHPADLADVAEALPAERVVEFLLALPASRTGQVLGYLNPELRTGLLEQMPSERAAELISAMSPDDRVDVLESLEQETREHIISDLPPEERQETERLAQYEPDTAGGLMTTRFVSVRASLSIEQALREVRAAARSAKREAMHAIYVVDDEDRLVGVMSLRELIAAPEGATVADVMTTEVMSVPASADRAEVARMTSEYDLVAIPVLDGFGRLVGVITVDDVIDAIEAEQTEDVQRLGAVQPLEEPYLVSGFWELAQKRVVWLVILFFGEMFTVSAMRGQLELIEPTSAATLSTTLAALSIFVPLIISSGGNSGSQSAMLITRALAVGEVQTRDALRVLRRELGQGLVLGTCLGLIGLVRALILPEAGAIGTVVALSLLLVVLTGTVVGAMLPLLLRRVGVDPAVASTPFVASVVDVTGIVIYFSVARYLLGLG